MKEVKQHLDMQMLERQQLKKQEADANVQFMKAWTNDQERENQLREEKAQ